jgi:hypothetical protein
MSDIKEYEEKQTLRKKAFKPAWDENGEGYNNTEFAFNTTQVDTALKDSLKKHYANLLSKAYKASTGESLKDPEKHIDPRYSYVIGRASNVNPAVLAKLNDFYRQRVAGWSTTGWNVDPGLAMDAAEIANQDSGVYPLNYRDYGLKRDAKYQHGQQVQTKLVNK